MQIIKRGIILVSFLLVIVACIDRYYLDEQITPSSKLVIDATIKNDTSAQLIKLSTSSSPDNPKYVPYSNCKVIVVDDKGQEYVFEESFNQEGYYYGVIDKANLMVGAKFQLSIETPNEENYVSEFEEMLPAPEIDSLYYDLTSIPTADPLINIDGVQFYLDFYANSNFPKNYRFELSETYEYHSTWPMRSYLDENGTFVNEPADYSKFVCYGGALIPDIFILSTSNLTENKYIKFPLHFVNDHTQRLLYNYSILLKQLTLSESAYNYWDIMKSNNQEAGGLYSVQPAAVKGNVFNVDNPEVRALGYFGVSSVKELRLTIKGGIEELSFSDVPYCMAFVPEVGYPPDPRPLYLAYTKDKYGNLVLGYAETECFDCTLLGGSVDKPWFFE